MDWKRMNIILKSGRRKYYFGAKRALNSCNVALGYERELKFLESDMSFWDELAVASIVGYSLLQATGHTKKETIGMSDQERIAYLEKKIEYLEKRIELLLSERENNNIVSSKSESRPPNRSKVPGLYIPECNCLTCVEKRKNK